MEEILTRVWQNLTARPGGPMAVRFYLQPAMAILFALRDGLRDARQGKPPFLWTIFAYPDRRKELLRDGWRSIAKIVIMALALDTLYQFLVLSRFYPGETMIVATCLAILPYALVRGPASRLARRRRQPGLESVAEKKPRDKAA